MRLGKLFLNISKIWKKGRAVFSVGISPLELGTLSWNLPPSLALVPSLALARPKKAEHLF